MLSSFCFSLAAEESELLNYRKESCSSLQLFLEPTIELNAGQLSVLVTMSDGGQAHLRAVGACELGTAVVVRAYARSLIAQQIFGGDTVHSSSAR